MRAFAQELGAGLRWELWTREDLDEVEVEALQKAESPIFLAPRQGYEVLYDSEGREAYSFLPQSPKTLPSAIEDLAWTIQEPEAEPVLAEELTREAYGFEEQPEAYYSRPWTERQADLVQDGLRLVAVQTAALQERAEEQVVERVPRLWDKLRERMQAISQWGRDLVATWSLSREVRKAEKDLAMQLGKPVEQQKLSRDPQELREILQNCHEAIQRVLAERQAQTAKKPKQDKGKMGIDF